MVGARGCAVAVARSGTGVQASPHFAMAARPRDTVEACRRVVVEYLGPFTQREAA